MSYYSSGDKKDGEFYQVIDVDDEENLNSPINYSQEMVFNPLGGLIILDNANEFNFNEHDQQRDENNESKDNYTPIEINENENNNSTDNYLTNEEMNNTNSNYNPEKGEQKQQEQEEEGQVEGEGEDGNYFDLQIDKDGSMFDEAGEENSKLNNFGNETQNNEENNIFLNRNSENENENTSTPNQFCTIENNDKINLKTSQEKNNLIDYDRLTINPLTILDESIDFENNLNLFDNLSNNNSAITDNNRPQNEKDINKEIKIENPHDSIKNKLNLMNPSHVKVKKKFFFFIK
jgi:hypothetical protein